jgi:hypothetical protein
MGRRGNSLSNLAGRGNRRQRRRPAAPIARSAARWRCRGGTSLPAAEALFAGIGTHGTRRTWRGWGTPRHANRAKTCRPKRAVHVVRRGKLRWLEGRNAPGEQGQRGLRASVDARRDPTDNQGASTNDVYPPRDWASCGMMGGMPPQGSLANNRWLRPRSRPRRTPRRRSTAHDGQGESQRGRRRSAR